MNTQDEDYDDIEQAPRGPETPEILDADLPKIYPFIKRILEIPVALILVICLLPIYLVITIVAYYIGKWKLEVGNWKLEVGNWKLENGKWKLENRFPFSNSEPWTERPNEKCEKALPTNP